MKRQVYFIVLVLICFSTRQACAQQEEKKSTGKTWVLLLPEFYHYKAAGNNDTTWKYECTRQHKPVNMDTVHNINDVDAIKLTKSYYRYPNTHKGAISPPYVSESLYVYERTGAATWVGVDQNTYYQTDLKENKKVTVRADTIEVPNLQTGAKDTIIHRYYKIITLGQGHHEDKD